MQGSLKLIGQITLNLSPTPLVKHFADKKKYS